MEIDDGKGEEPEDGAVGYGRPPRQSRWKKGQSGNPSGRPKGTRGLKTDLRAELISRMEISMNGKRVSGTKQQLMLRTLTARAAAGDVKATRILIDLVLQVFGPEDQGGGPKTLSRPDQQILDELLGRKTGPSVIADARPQDRGGIGGETQDDAMSTNPDPDNHDTDR
ncbi:hypothetical protein A6F68_00090 [Tsuneonella dongtanensis]|uniref:DUF5681 domain-containing protein n=1 Tax=Tsuneonella dongtanensis TaxID=692370 RepID=A0A1B2A8Z8_9SPHN|nr:DUF5681 domain-containing protein [Tsuneonella dongtanensis]ANY18626.1 hypothetical protein A6F68_00090 [Tsuneonella dongtanensis]